MSHGRPWAVMALAKIHTQVSTAASCGHTPMPQWPNGGGGGGLEWVHGRVHDSTHSSADWWDLLFPLA